jgi:hypothetical protein
LLIITLFSGCSFKLASSTDDLISPISPFGENANIKKAMDSFASNGYSLKIPSNGDFVTSYNFHDIDGDGNDEAFAFYEPSDDLGAINMAILKQVDSNWTVVDNINGNAKDIYSLDFCDVTGDGKEEILVCWDAISNSSSHIFSLYSYSLNDNSIKLSHICSDVTVSSYVCLDTDNDSKNEIMMFLAANVDSVSAKAELYSVSDDKYVLLGETKLDSSISSFSNIQIENNNNDIRVYADAIRTDGESSLTELIYWSDTYETIISPFYNYSTGRTKDTTRTMVIDSTDINDDGTIEIPLKYESIKLPSNVNAVDWNIFKSDVLIHSAYTLAVKQDEYQILLDDDIIDNISVSYDKSTREMKVKNKSTKSVIFSIMPVLKAVYSSADYSEYDIIWENSGYYYIAKSGDDKDIKITTNQLESMIKSY